MSNGLQINLNVLRIGRLFLTSTLSHSGYQVAKALKIKRATTYDVLDRLQETGWLRSAIEASAIPGRPPRRLYELTDSGRREVSETLAMLGAT